MAEGLDPVYWLRMFITAHINLYWWERVLRSAALFGEMATNRKCVEQGIYYNAIVCLICLSYS